MDTLVGRLMSTLQGTVAATRQRRCVHVVSVAMVTIHVYGRLTFTHHIDIYVNLVMVVLVNCT